MATLDFSIAHQVEDDAVILRLLRPSDAEHLLHFARNEPEIWNYSLIRINNEEELTGYLQLAEQQYQEQKEYPFIVYDKRSGTYAGSTRFYDIQLAASTLQLGYTWYGKAYQGTGLNRHCKLLLLQFAFETLGMERVEFRADARNARSIAAMKKIGCVEEGILRNHLVLPDGGRRSSIILSILRSEWENGGKEKLQALVQQAR